MKKDENGIFNLVGQINLSKHLSENKVVEALNEITSTAAMQDIGLETKILGIDVGASIFGFLNEQRIEFKEMQNKVSTFTAHIEELIEENHRLEGSKKVAQAIRSRVLEDYKKRQINISWDNSVIQTGNAAARRGAAREDCCLYKDTVR